jgi:broad specificity phosphatase PhoE
LTKQPGRLGLVRHGQTAANIDQVWHGHTDTELTELGHRQARSLGAYFHHYMRPEVIYASPLQRARLTAEAVGERFAIPVQLDPRLRELSLGDWEGVTFESMRGDNGTMRKLVREPDFTPPNGESQNLVRKRMVAAIEDITRRHPGQNVVLFTHGVAMGIALSYLVEGDSSLWHRYTKDNTAFSELCLSTRTLLSFNRTDHLTPVD